MHRLGLTYDETIDGVDIKYTSATSIGYTLPPAMYKICDPKSMLKSLLRDDVKVNIRSDNIRLKSKLTTNNTNRFTKKHFFYTILLSTQSDSEPLCNFEAFFQLISGSYKSNKPIRNTEIDKIHFKKRLC